MNHERREGREYKGGRDDPLESKHFIEWVKGSFSRNLRPFAYFTVRTVEIRIMNGSEKRRR